MHTLGLIIVNESLDDALIYFKEGLAEFRQIIPLFLLKANFNVPCKLTHLRTEKVLE